jgi:hypothetical protein
MTTRNIELAKELIKMKLLVFLALLDGYDV